MEQNQEKPRKLSKVNENRAFIYTEDCTMCGLNTELQPIIDSLREAQLEVHTKQTSLWPGWKEEAAKIGIELPFVWVYKTGKGKPLSEAFKDGIDDILP